MRYFVTGATGFLGGSLVRQLVAAGNEVVTVARTPQRAGDLRDLGIEVHGGDITDRATLIEPMRGADGVFHVAGWYRIGVRDTSPGHAINVQGTRNVLEVMRELDIPRGVYTSSLAVFSDTNGRVLDESYRYNGPHLTEYDRTKWLAHYEVAEPMVRDGLPLITVQPGLIYGPGDNSLLHQTWVQFLKRRLWAVPGGTAYCWGHVEDTARGHVLAMETGRPGETYIIAGPVHTVAEAMRMASDITGIPAPRVEIPGGILRALAPLMKPFDGRLPLPETYTYEGLRSTAGVTYLGSNTKARRELGFEPRSLEEGLPPTLEWEMQQLGRRD